MEVIRLSDGGYYRDILNSFLSDVHSGKLTSDSIQPDYYKNLCNQLAAAVTEGLGGDSFPEDDSRNTLKAYFDQNIYAFSGAKSLVMLQEFNKLLLDDNGEILPFNEFKQRVLSVDELYNKTYLNAEYNNAIASAQMAEKWQGLQGFTYLQYRTAGDDRVRPEHAMLDNMILKSVDPIWNTIYPPNGWNCRCTVIPGADSDTPMDRTDAKQRVKAADIKPYFRNNVGKDKVIFKDSHPYMRNIKPSHIRDFDAVKNYGMPSVESIYKTVNLPEYDYLPSKEDALTWWNKQAGSKKGAFDIKTKDGLTASFDRGFKNHVLESNTDNRWKYLDRLPEVLKSPDEVWGRLVDGKQQISYIKYYKSGPVMVKVDGEGVRGTTMYQTNKNGRVNYTSIESWRKGQLKYRK